MRITARLILLAVALAALPALRAQQEDPIPVAVVKYKGQEMPVYEIKQVLPVHTECPQYPREEQIQKIEGSALIAAVVGENGRVVEAEIVTSAPNAAFGPSALEAVLQWRFPKTKRDGKPTRFIVRVPVSFKIE